MVVRLLLFAALVLRAEQLYPGIAYTQIGNAHVVVVDLSQPGLRFRVTPSSGSRETVRQTTLDFLREQHAQVAINAHFFEPFPSEDREAFLIGPAASDGNTYSDFETPRQSYAILADAPVLNIDAQNRARIVHRGDGVSLFNAVAGSAQILTSGVVTIPRYGEGALTPGGPNNYSNADSWYERAAARTVIGLSQDASRLFFLVLERSTVAEAANLLLSQGGWDGINLDGGGSSSLAIEDPATHESRLRNSSEGRAVGSNIALSIDNVVLLSQ